MNAYKTYLNIENSQQLVLSNLPFQPGQRVEAIVLPVTERPLPPPSGQWENEPISEAEFRQLNESAQHPVKLYQKLLLRNAANEKLFFSSALIKVFSLKPNNIPSISSLSPQTIAC